MVSYSISSINCPRSGPRDMPLHLLELSPDPDCGSGNCQPVSSKCKKVRMARAHVVRSGSNFNELIQNWDQ